MEFQFHFLVVAVLVAGALATSATDKRVNCIHGKYKNELGTIYSRCHNSSSHLQIPRIKKCFDEVMKDAQVYKVAANGQMTVEKTKFQEYATANSNKQIGKAMNACIRKNEERMYNEIARASQCVFDQVKETCKK